MAAAAFAALGVKVQSLRKSPDAAADDVPPKCWATVSEDLGTALTVFHATVGSISRSITKLSLVGKMLPDEASAASICSNSTNCASSSLSSALVAAHCGAGGPMRELYFKGANRILNATVEVAVSLSQQQWSDVPPATGKVWEACEAVVKLPKTPKAAYKRKLLAFCVELKVRFRAAYFHAGMNAGGTLITRLVSYAAQDQISEFNEKIEASSSKRAGDDAGDEPLMSAPMISTRSSSTRRTMRASFPARAAVRHTSRARGHGAPARARRDGRVRRRGHGRAGNRR